MLSLGRGRRRASSAEETQQIGARGSSAFLAGDNRIGVVTEKTKLGTDGGTRAAKSVLAPPEEADKFHSGGSSHQGPSNLAQFVSSGNI